ncbi:class I SAM-dependent methyltransferase [Pseudoalteromonas sp. YIC-827]|uniref:Class I SAM-dependent methyltransferase n=1 Tax=Pseudoalteromonas qingdaonensis TaxID=3131913 RepID=A0ABU9MY91_9GAMM
MTGVDLSSKAIAQANALKHALGLDAQFIEADIYRFGQENTQQHDLVFTSYSTICWLPDLTL